MIQFRRRKTIFTEVVVESCEHDKNLSIFKDNGERVFFFSPSQNTVMVIGKQLQGPNFKQFLLKYRSFITIRNLKVSRKQAQLRRRFKILGGMQG